MRGDASTAFLVDGTKRREQVQKQTCSRFFWGHRPTHDVSAQEPLLLTTAFQPAKVQRNGHYPPATRSQTPAADPMAIISTEATLPNQWITCTGNKRRQRRIIKQ